MCADLAILRNGFSDTPRAPGNEWAQPPVYLGSDKGYIDIATDQIERFERLVSGSCSGRFNGRHSTVATAVVPASMAKPQSMKPQDPEPGNQYHQRPTSHRS
jgi:hypothetical protein